MRDIDAISQHKNKDYLLHHANCINEVPINTRNYSRLPDKRV